MGQAKKLLSRPIAFIDVASTFDMKNGRIKIDKKRINIKIKDRILYIKSCINFF